MRESVGSSWGVLHTMGEGDACCVSALHADSPPQRPQPAPLPAGRWQCVETRLKRVAARPACPRGAGVMFFGFLIGAVGEYLEVKPRHASLSPATCV